MKTATTQNGRVSKTVSVFTDAAGAENLRLRFTVEIRMPIEALPTFRFVLNTIEGRRSKGRILLRRTDGEELIIRKTKVPLVGAAVTAVPVDAAPPGNAASGENQDSTPWGAATPLQEPAAAPGDVWVEMTADATLAAGRYSDSVRLETNHPEAAEIQIPYTIRVRPLIDARPAVVRLWTAPATLDPGRSAVVTLSHYGDRKFSITGVEVSNPGIFTAAAYSPEPSTQQSVRIGLVEGLDSATLGDGTEGWIRVRTDDPERALLELPVLVAPTQNLSRRPVSGVR